MSRAAHPKPYKLEVKSYPSTQEVSLIQPSLAIHFPQKYELCHTYMIQSSQKLWSQTSGLSSNTMADAGNAVHTVHTYSSYTTSVHIN